MVDAANGEDINKSREDDSNSNNPDSDIFKDIDIERNARNRIKVYTHDEHQNSWDDIGTGHVQCLTKEPELQHYIHFRSDGKDFDINWRIKPDMKFARQQDTLIIFTPLYSLREIALSFQSKEGTDLFLRDLSCKLGRELTEFNEDLDESVQSSDDETDVVPLIRLATLGEFEKLSAFAQKSILWREKFIAAFQQNSWLSDLSNLYNISTDLEDTFSLALIGQITKNFIMLNDPGIIQIMCHDSNMKTVLQLLSYSADEKFTDHVDFLYNKAKCKQVITIQNEGIIELIHEAYRIQYIMDVCLPPKQVLAVALEENGIAAIETYLNALRSHILSSILKEERLETELIDALKSHETVLDDRHNLLMFLGELIKLADNNFMTLPQKKDVMEALFKMDILQFVKPCLISGDYIIRKTTIGILMQVAQFDVKEVLEFIIDDSLSHAMTEPFIMNEIVSLISYDPDPELQLAAMVVQLARVLIGPEDQPLDYPVQRQQFAGLFFKRSFGAILEPLLQSVKVGKLVEDTYRSSRKASLIISFVSYCARRYPVLSRVHLISSNVLLAVAASISSKHPSLSLVALKLIKTVAITKDDFYIRHIINTNVLATTMTVFFDKYMYSNNMYNSSYLEFFDYIAKNDQVSLIKYIMDNFGNKMENLTYSRTFSLMRTRYRTILHADIYEPKTPESLPDKEDVPLLTPPEDCHFKPRAPTLKLEDDAFSNDVQVRPATPIPKRIVVKIPRQLGKPQELENDSEVPLLFADKTEPMRLVEYDDSDSETSDQEDADAVQTPREYTSLEQRKRKRTSSIDDADEVASASRPKRLIGQSNEIVDGI